MEDFKELDLEKIASVEDFEKVIVEKLGLTLLEVKQAICSYVNDNSEKLSKDFINIAPYEDYGKLLEEKVDIAHFLKTEVVKPENWEIKQIKVDSESNNLLEFSFACTAVDDGNNMSGYAYVSLDGLIRHAFACGE